MDITFEKLKASHFPLLYKWLLTPHVRAWWDSNSTWTPEKVENKYSQYVNGYKRMTLGDQVIEKPMHAFVILCDGIEIGYIQYYKKQDFPSEYGYDASELPENLAGLDWYIGEPDYLRRGIGSRALKAFVEDYVFTDFESVFVDPKDDNGIAIHTYEKAGFITRKIVAGVAWMIRDK